MEQLESDIAYICFLLFLMNCIPLMNCSANVGYIQEYISPPNQARPHSTNWKTSPWLILLLVFWTYSLTFCRAWLPRVSTWDWVAAYISVDLWVPLSNYHSRSCHTVPWWCVCICPLCSAPKRACGDRSFRRPSIQMTKYRTCYHTCLPSKLRDWRRWGFLCGCRKVHCLVCWHWGLRF